MSLEFESLDFQHLPTGKLHLIKDFIAGGVGGICLVIIGHPPDTIKVRLQTMPLAVPGTLPLYTGVIDCVKKTVNREGYLALYKGVGPIMMGVTPISALSFFGNSLGKWLQTPSKPNGEYSSQQLFLAGSAAGITNTIVLTPVDRIKCTLQVQGMSSLVSDQQMIRPRYYGSWDCAQRLYYEGGLRSLYRGLSITIVRGIPSWGVYFCTYDGLKRSFAQSKITSDQPLSTVHVLCAGGTAGLCSWLVAMPADVLKSRLQSAPLSRYPKGARDVFREMRQNEGLRALYRGTTAILIRAFPANAACFLGYEATMHMLNKIL